MKCYLVVGLCLLLTLSTESEGLKILKKIKDFLHPSTTTALPVREHEEKQDHSWAGEKDSAESSDSDSRSSESNTHSNSIGHGGVRSTARPSHSSGSGGNENSHGGSSGPGYETTTIKSSDSLKPDHPFDVDDNSESQWGGPTTPAENGKHTNIYTSGFNNRQSTTKPNKQPSYSTQGAGQEYNNGQSTDSISQLTAGGSELTYGSDQSKPGGIQSTYDKDKSTTESQSSYNNGQSTSSGTQSTYNNGQSTSAGSQSTFNNGHSTTGSTQSTYGNGQSNQNNGQSTKQPDSYNSYQSTTERITNYGQNDDRKNSNEPKNDSHVGALVFPDHPLLEPSPEPNRSYDHHNVTHSSDPLDSSTNDPREGKAEGTGVSVDDGRHVIDAPSKQCPPGKQLSNGICRTQASPISAEPEPISSPVPTSGAVKSEYHTKKKDGKNIVDAPIKECPTGQKLDYSGHCRALI